MTVRMVGSEQFGDGRVQILGRTDAGNRVSIVVGNHLLNSGVAAAMLEREGARMDATAAALRAREGRTESEE